MDDERKRVDDLGSTRWGDVEALRRSPSPAERQAAFDRIVARYSPALLARVRDTLERLGARAILSGEAEDVLQEFLATAYEREWLQRADATRGRFRDYLRVLVTRYARDVVRRSRAARRSPRGRRILSLDAEGVAAPRARTHDADSDFAAHWVECLVRAAVDRVRARSTRSAELVESILREEARGGGALERLSTREKVARHRARRMLAEEIWTEMRATVLHPEDLEAERRTLLPYLGRYLDPDAIPSFFGRA